MGVNLVKRTLPVIITVFMFFAQTLCAQNKSVKNENQLKDVGVSIKFYDRTMYYPGKTDENPIKVHVTITNKGSEPLRFKLAEDRMFSVDFKAFNIKNTLLSSTQSLQKKRKTNQTVYYREISLEPEEEYSFVENLKQYLDITEPSIYYVELEFFPELYRNGDYSIKSNRLSLEVKPSPSASSSTMLNVENENGAILERQEISPDKVVEQTIVARQRTLWDQFFLYLDLEEILKRNASRKRRYDSSSAAERNEMLREFKADLMKNRIDFDIVAIPSSFEIQTTTYDQTKGYVKVEEWFKNDTFTEKKLYTYYVRQRDGIWQIYDYTVTNSSNE